MYTALLALSVLAWRLEVPQHEYVSKFKDKEKFTHAALEEIVPIADTDLLDKERAKGFVQAFWTFTVFSVAAYCGMHGPEKKTEFGDASSSWGDDDLLVCSKGATGAAKVDVLKCRLEALKSQFHVADRCRCYTPKPGADWMDVTTACRGCRNAGCGIKHHWFHECPGFDGWGRSSLWERSAERLPVILAPADFQDTGGVIWRWVWAACRGLWKSQCVDFVDALQASSWSKSAMGTYCGKFQQTQLVAGLHFERAVGGGSM